jgi:LysR family transcriptional regulator, glycine cleavage system transcriptional activator
MNKEDRRTLPPMAMLHSFAAATRHGSFSRAAAEVGLTQSAISRQIANLEEWIGATLFERSGRRVRLNEAGRVYADDILPALAAIRRATARAATRPQERVVELATLPSFGMRWLAPRLPRLTERHPDLIVNFAARTDEFDFAAEPFDAAIHFGRADWPGAACDLLFHEAAIPVVSSALAAGIRAPADFARLPLLVQSNRRDAWARWFALAGVDHVPEGPLPGFSHFLMLAQAAAAGAGAALVPSFLIGPELASGALVSPIDLPLPSARAYYLVYPPARMDSSAFRALRDWMLDEAGAASSDRL